jgi:ABC-type oligopeptide transport system ATPase subunit
LFSAESTGCRHDGVHDRGEIVERGPPKEFFANPKNDRTKLFLSQILAH